MRRARTEQISHVASHRLVGALRELQLECQRQLVQVRLCRPTRALTLSPRRKLAYSVSADVSTRPFEWVLAMRRLNAPTQANQILTP